MITHDLGVVSRVSDDVLVMYAGRAVERGAVREVLNRPQHPWGLLLEAREKCAAEEPPLVARSARAPGHLTACHVPEEGTTSAPPSSASSISAAPTVTP